MQIAMSPEELLPDLKLRWLGEPANARLGESSVAITAGATTDWFIDPSRAAAPVLNAPALVGSPSGDFLLSSRVAVEFASTFDAGALVLYGDQRVWAKLCFELSPARAPMVVSVVTRDLSDDCNSAVVDADHVWLRVSRIGAAFAFHSSSDGATWNLVRHFAASSDRRAARRLRGSVTPRRGLHGVVHRGRLRHAEIAGPPQRRVIPGSMMRAGC